MEVLDRPMPDIDSGMVERLNLLTLACNKPLMDEAKQYLRNRRRLRFCASMSAALLSGGTTLAWILGRVMESQNSVVDSVQWGLMAVFVPILVAVLVNVLTSMLLRMANPLSRLQFILDEAGKSGWDSELLDAYRGMLVAKAPEVPIPELASMVPALKSGTASRRVLAALGEADSLAMMAASGAMAKFSYHAMRVRDGSGPMPELVLSGETHELLARVASALTEGEHSFAPQETEQENTRYVV